MSRRLGRKPTYSSLVQFLRTQKGRNFLKQFQTFDGLLQIAQNIDWDGLGKWNRVQETSYRIAARKKNNKRAHK